MTGEMKIAAAVGGAAVAVAAAVGAPPAPEGFWPQTIGGWIGMVTGVISVVVSLYLLYKWSLSPVVLSIGQVDAKIVAIERHFDRAIQEVEARMEERMNEFTQATERRMNEFGQRVRDNESDFDALNAMMTKIDKDLAVVTEHGRRTTERSDEIARMLIESERSRQSFEREMLLRLTPRNTQR